MAKPNKATEVANDQVNDAQVTDLQKAAAEHAEQFPPKEEEPAKKEPTSDELTKLRAEIADQYKVVQAAATNVMSPEFMEATMKLLKLQSAETAEIANIAKHERELEILEKRNARVAWIDELLNAYVENNTVANTPDATIEDKNAAFAAFNNVKEKIANELLKTVGGSTPSKSAATGTTATGNAKGGITAAIRAIIIPMYAEGKSGAEVRKAVIKEHKYNDGTANAVIKAYEVEAGIK